MLKNQLVDHTHKPYEWNKCIFNSMLLVHINKNRCDWKKTDELTAYCYGKGTKSDYILIKTQVQLIMQTTHHETLISFKMFHIEAECTQVESSHPNRFA